jgi:hypothetical protein
MGQITGKVNGGAITHFTVFVVKLGARFCVHL